MAPHIQDGPVLIPVPKGKGAVFDHDNVPKPVANDFMYDFKYNHSLPTTDVLGVDIPADCDAQKEAEGIVARLSTATSEGDAQAFAALFLDYGKKVQKRPLFLLSLPDIQASGVTSSPSPGTSAHSTSEPPS